MRAGLASRPGRSWPARWLGVATLALALALAGCSGSGTRDGGPRGQIDFAKIPDAIPKVEPKSRYGNPPSYVVDGTRYDTLDSSKGHQERGIASWYGTKFHGLRTSSGDPYDMYAMTAAHKSLPLPTYARVTNLRTGRAITVRINDRGPFVANRIIDLSYVAAGKLGILEGGTGLVEVTAIDPLYPGAAPLASADYPIPSAGRPAPNLPRPALAPTTAVPAGPTLYLQAGAFGSRQNAERLRERMAAQIPERVRIQPLQRDNLTLFRVQVGPLDSVDQVDELTSRLQDLGISGAQVVIE